MKRRNALARLAMLAVGAAASALPAAQRSGNTALSTMRTASGWIAVLGQRGETIITISPRFLAEHPIEALRLMTGGMPR